MIKKIKQNQNDFDFTIYELSVDQSMKLSDKVQFTDSTMGYLTGNSADDGLKALDNRIAKYVEVTKTSEETLHSVGSGKYQYVMTPLVIWYQNGMEVKISNIVVSKLQADEDGNLTYDSFVEFLSFPTEKPNWNEEFNLNSF